VALCGSVSHLETSRTSGKMTLHGYIATHTAVSIATRRRVEDGCHAARHTQPRAEMPSVRVDGLRFNESQVSHCLFNKVPLPL
jgi:hypothetical protein